jgi:nucleoside-diphosphate-sugar epimerase
MQRSNKAKNSLGKTWLITGGTGFVGTNLRVNLNHKGVRDVVIVDNGLYNTGYKDDMKSSKHYKIDILNYEALHDVFGAVKPDYVIHLAGNTEVRKSTRRPMLCFDTNVTGTLNCLNLCRDFGVEKFIVASSCGVVGDSWAAVNESSDLNPISPYAASKACVELVSKSYEKLGVSVIILRFGNIYGPWSAHKSSVIPKFVRNHIEGVPFDVYGNGWQKRNFIYVEDAVKGIFAAIDKNHTGLFCIGGLKSYSVNDVIDVFEENFNSKIKRNIKRKGKEEVGDIEIDTSKARRLLSFYCQYSLLDGINKTYDWYKENEYAS